MNALIGSTVASPSGTAPNWRGSWSRTASWWRSPRRPCAGSWPHINCNHGVITSGCIPSTHGMPDCMPPSPHCSHLTRVHSATMRSCAPWTRRPRCRRVRGWPRPSQPSRRTGPTTRSTSIHAPGPSTSSRLEHVDQEIAEHIRTIHLVCDHVSTHHGKEVTRWFAKHPRLVVHFTPVHGSWMNPVEQWFSILQRKRWRIVDFISKDHLRVKLEPFIREWNQQAHPFNWSTKSVAKVMAEAPALAA